MPTCNFCKTEIKEVFSLNHQPPSNSFLTRKQLGEPEIYYPLNLYVCPKCWLVQVPEVKKASEIFNEDYVYYSSQSPANVNHAKEFVDVMVERFNPRLVLEIGSNDGYLLQHFPEGTHVLGIDSASGPAQVARNRGIPTSGVLFSSKVAEKLLKNDLVIGINVLAHQPDINDFVEGLRIALSPKGVIVMEFPHVMKMVDGNQFDTIYHEHYSYFSFTTICRIFAKHELEVFDVEEIPEHGGSLRVYARHKKVIFHMYAAGEVLRLIEKERDKKIDTMPYYELLESRCEAIRTNLLRFLIDIPEDKLIMAYGAAAKGNTLLNYCGVRSDFIPYVVDRSPHKQDKFLPGSHLLVVNEKEIRSWKPDYILILPWNLKAEIMEQLNYVREWGCKFVTAIPEVEVI